MTPFRALWLLHRWIGIGLGFVLLLTATTGFLLLLKKDFAWLQPPMLRAQPGPPHALQPLGAVCDAVFRLDLPAFRTADDIARIDFRPAQGVHKVLSVHDHLEVQVCATTLATSGPEPRRSDWIEQMHDGSWFGGPVHRFVMPAAALGLLFLACSGYVMWFWPKWRRRNRA